MLWWRLLLPRLWCGLLSLLPAHKDDHVYENDDGDEVQVGLYNPGSRHFDVRFEIKR